MMTRLDQLIVSSGGSFEDSIDGKMKTTIRNSFLTSSWEHVAAPFEVPGLYFVKRKEEKIRGALSVFSWTVYGNVPLAEYILDADSFGSVPAGSEIESFKLRKTMNDEFRIEIEDPVYFLSDSYRSKEVYKWRRDDEKKTDFLTVIFCACRSEEMDSLTEAVEKVVACR